nr:MAG TPA: hypothetical protein [Caudoviricetes sp.]
MKPLDHDYPYATLEVIYTLKPRYAQSYQYAIVQQHKTTGKIVVTLWSNWSTSYNVIQRYPAGELKAVLRKYSARKRAIA